MDKDTPSEAAIDTEDPGEDVSAAETEPSKEYRAVSLLLRRFHYHALPLVRSWAAYITLPLAGLVTAPIVARALGPAGRGQLAGVLQPMVLAGSVAALGVPSAVAYFIGRGYNKSRVCSSAMKVALAMTAVVAAILVAYSSNVSRDIGINHTVILLVWCAFLPSAFISIRRAYLQGMRQYQGIDLERALNSLLRAGFIAALFLLGISSVPVYAVFYMVAGLTASLALRRRQDRNTPSPREPGLLLRRWELPRYALFSSFGTIAVAMNSRLDQAIMPLVVPAVGLGYYAVAVTVSEVPLIINAVAARNILAETSARVPRRHILGRFLIGAAGQLLLSGVVLVTTPFLLPLVFGRSFTPAVVLVKILLLSTTIAYGADCASAHLAGVGRPGCASLSPAVGAVTTVVLFVLCWHRMSALVAAWISVATQGATLFTGALLISLFAIQSSKDKLAKVG